MSNNETNLRWELQRLRLKHASLEREIVSLKLAAFVVFCLAWAMPGANSRGLLMLATALILLTRPLVGYILKRRAHTSIWHG